MNNQGKAIFVIIMVVYAASAFCADQPTKNDKIIYHEVFGGLLFDHLELGKPNIEMSQEQKISSLQEYNYQPFNGYQIGQAMTLGQTAVILVRVYALESKLPDNYTEKDAILKLIEEKILPDNQKDLPPETLIDYPFGIDVINSIPRGPGVVPKKVLLPRIPVKPPVSRVE
jgi:hypothetical protein